MFGDRGCLILYSSWAKLRFWSMNCVPYIFDILVVHIRYINTPNWLRSGWVVVKKKPYIMFKRKKNQGFTKTLLMMTFYPFLSFLDWMLPYLCEIKLYSAEHSSAIVMVWWSYKFRMNLRNLIWNARYVKRNVSSLVLCIFLGTNTLLSLNIRIRNLF